MVRLLQHEEVEAGSGDDTPVSVVLGHHLILQLIQIFSIFNKYLVKRVNLNFRLKILIIEIFPLNASICRGRGRLRRESNSSFSRLTSQYIYNTQTESNHHFQLIAQELLIDLRK